MASITTDRDGRRRIQFVAPNGKRRAVHLGKVSQRTAAGVKYRIEQLLESINFNRPMEADLIQWVKGLETSLAKKLARVKLIPDPKGAPIVTVGSFLDSWLAGRKTDFKPASVIAWGQVINAMKEFFGEDCRLTKVTTAKAEAFRQSMIEAGLRATTIHKRLQHARMFFAHAKRQELVSENPFEFVRHRPGDASERRAYVPAVDVMRAIEHAPNETWKLLIALSRFGGLRVPSEALSLRWQDVDWERQRIVIPSPKTEHLAGKGYRVIPLFPAIRPHLEAAFETAPEGAVYVIPEEYRRRAQTAGGWANANLRTTLERVIRRAGLEAWPRLWHSMRASCETDLARQFPLAVVAKWLGNTQAVAMRHYVDVTDGDFERAVSIDLAIPLDATKKAAQKTAQPAYAEARFDSLEPRAAHRKTPVLPGLANTCDSVQVFRVEAAGIEPASRDISTQASTCVSSILHSQGGATARGTPRRTRRKLV